jgi:hypothetical protein
MDGPYGPGTVAGMTTTAGNSHLNSILGRIGLPEPAVTDSIERELTALFAELGVAARLSSLRHRRIVIESDPTGAAILRFAKDTIAARANTVAPGSVDTVVVRAASKLPGVQ